MYVGATLWHVHASNTVFTLRASHTLFPVDFTMTDIKEEEEEMLVRNICSQLNVQFLDMFLSF